MSACRTPLRQLLLALSLFASGFASGPSMADATAPADGQIKAVLADLDRFEAEARTLSPSRSANIRRLQRSLDLAEQRLASSPNKTHPSWEQAAARLATLRTSLDGLLAGNTAPATAAPPPQPVSAGDPELADFTSRVTALEADAAAMGPGDVDAGNALVGRLNALIAEYKTKPRQGAGWSSAARSLNALGPRITARAREAAPASAGSAPATAAAPVLGSHDRAKLARVSRDIEGLAADVERLTAVALQDADTAAGWRARLERHEAGLRTFDSVRDDPGVAAAAARLAEARTRYASLEQEAAAQLADLGDVRGRFAAIEQRYTGSDRIPEALREPIDRDSVDNWSQAYLYFQRQQQADAAWLDSVNGRTSLIPANDFARIHRWVVQDVPGRMKAAVDKTYQDLDGRIAATLGTIEFMAKVGPDDRHRIVNLYLNTEMFSQRMREMDETDALLDLVIRLDEALGRDAAAHRADKARLAGFRTQIAKTSDSALQESRMPASTTDDPQLLAIATETLKNPKYGVGEWRRLVINAPKRHQEERRYHFSGSSLVGYDVVWDQFQVATAEPEGDAVYIWYNTLKYFHKAYHTTPTGRWLVSDRFKSSRILPENVNR